MEATSQRSRCAKFNLLFILFCLHFYTSTQTICWKCGDFNVGSKTYLNKPRNSWGEANWNSSTSVSSTKKTKAEDIISRPSPQPLVPRARASSVWNGLTRGKAKILQNIFHFSALKLQAKEVFLSQRETISKMLCEKRAWKCRICFSASFLL